MPYNFDATKDYLRSSKNILILLHFAQRENDKGNQENRSLFLKLSVVFLVTRFQVYVEGILKEFDYKIKQTNKLNNQIPLHFRLNSIKIETENNQIHKKLENPTTYKPEKFNEINSLILLLVDWCDDGKQIHPDLKMETKFPLGATGLKELKKLFLQIDGKDIFGKVKFDIEKLNEILRRRHSIIHEDANQQITELTVKEYRAFIKKVVTHVDRYLSRIIV